MPVNFNTMERKKNKEFTHLGSLLDNVVSAIRHDADVEMLQIWNLWDSAVGEEIAKNARPAAFKGNMLIVNVTSSPWMQQLQFLKKDIMNKINDAAETDLISEIKFKIGTV